MKRRELAGLSTLIVDDEPPVRRVVRAMLERLGCEVHEAEDGLDALLLHRRNRYGLVVTDIVMPEVGGLSLIKALLGCDPAPRILAISGGGPTGRLKFLSTARTFPGVATLEKPFQLADLVRKVCELGPGNSG